MLCVVVVCSDGAGCDDNGSMASSMRMQMQVS